MAKKYDAPTQEGLSDWAAPRYKLILETYPWASSAEQVMAAVGLALDTPDIPGMDSSLLTSVRDKYDKLGALSPMQWFWALYISIRVYYPDKFASLFVGEVEAGLDPGLTGIVEFMKGYVGLTGSKPVIRLQGYDAHGGVLKLRLGLSSTGQSIKVTGGITHSGLISADGAFSPTSTLKNSPHMGSVMALLKSLSDNPVKAVAQYGHMTGTCSFCGGGLGTDKSKMAGYGPTCAKNWGLPWGPFAKEPPPIPPPTQVTKMGTMIASAYAAKAPSAIGYLYSWVKGGVSWPTTADTWKDLHEFWPGATKYSVPTKTFLALNPQVGEPLPLKSSPKFIGYHHKYGGSRVWVLLSAPIDVNEAKVLLQAASENPSEVVLGDSSDGGAATVGLEAYPNLIHADLNKIEASVLAKTSKILNVAADSAAGVRVLAGRRTIIVPAGDVYDVTSFTAEGPDILSLVVTRRGSVSGGLHSALNGYPSAEVVFVPHSKLDTVHPAGTVYFDAEDRPWEVHGVHGAQATDGSSAYVAFVTPMQFVDTTFVPQPCRFHPETGKLLTGESMERSGTYWSWVPQDFMESSLPDVPLLGRCSGVWFRVRNAGQAEEGYVPVKVCPVRSESVVYGVPMPANPHIAPGLQVPLHKKSWYLRDSPKDRNLQYVWLPRKYVEKVRVHVPGVGYCVFYEGRVYFLVESVKASPDHLLYIASQLELPPEKPACPEAPAPDQEMAPALKQGHTFELLMAKAS